MKLYWTLKRSYIAWRIKRNWDKMENRINEKIRLEIINPLIQDIEELIKSGYFEPKQD